MAETAITPQQAARGGTALTYANADTSNGNKIANNGKTWIRLFNNGATGSATVTITTPGSVDGNAVADLPVTLSVGQEKTVPPLEPSIYNNASGDVILTTTGTGAADVDIQAFYQ